MYVYACARSQGVSKVVWVPAPSLREEGSSTLHISDLFFTPHGTHGGGGQLSVKLSSLCICAMLTCKLKTSRFTTPRVVNIDILLLAMYVQNLHLFFELLED